MQTNTILVTSPFLKKMISIDQNFLSDTFGDNIPDADLVNEMFTCENIQALAHRILSSANASMGSSGPVLTDEVDITLRCILVANTQAIVPQFKGQVPVSLPAIGLFAKITVLSFHDMQIEDFPYSVKHMKELVELNITKCNLKTYPEVGNLSKLQILNLQKNKLKFVFDSEISPSLFQLDISDNPEITPNNVKEIAQNVRLLLSDHGNFLDGFSNGLEIVPVLV